MGSSQLYPEDDNVGSLEDAVARLRIINEKKLPGSLSQLVEIDWGSEDLREAVERLNSGLEVLRRYEIENRDSIMRVVSALELILIDLQEQRDERSFVGTSVWTLKKGEQWILSPEMIYRFYKVDRRALWRQPYMLERQVSKYRKLIETIQTMLTRKLTGEDPVFDLYTGRDNDSQLSISAGVVAGHLKRFDVRTAGIIARSGCYYGNQPGVRYSLKTVLEEDYEVGKRNIFRSLKKGAYGLGFIFQKFSSIPGHTDTEFIMGLDGDYTEVKLIDSHTENGKPLNIDPRHVIAWDESVTSELIKLGGVLDRFLRGEIPYHVRFKGTGKVWITNLGYNNGYWGNVFSPAIWVYEISGRIKNVIRNLTGGGK